MQRHFWIFTKPNNADISGVTSSNYLNLTMPKYAEFHPKKTQVTVLVNASNHVKKRQVFTPT